MRVLLIHRYFWPDTPPYASMLRAIGKRLVEDGCEVSVLSSQPSYKSSVTTEHQLAKEMLDGMSVHRVRLLREVNRRVFNRLLNMVYFPLRVFLFVLLKGKFDLVMVSTAPPVVLSFAAALATKLRGGDFFYHCMDIHPEIGALSGEFRNPFIYKVLQALDQFSCKVASKVIVLSGDMKISLERRSGYKNNNITVLNNFSMPFHGEVMSVDDDLFKGEGKFRVLFAGNLGRFQGLEIFIDAMNFLDHKSDIELVFLGEGSALSALKRQAEGVGSIKFLSHQPVGVARSIINNADLGIVSLSKGIYNYAFPSKTMTYLEEGCPLLVSIERESELADFVYTNDIGVCVDHSSAELIAYEIEYVFLDKKKQESMKENALLVSKKMFSDQVVLDKWSLLVSKLNKEH